MMLRKFEEIPITDRGAPIAKIIPLNRGADMMSGRMALLERAGLLRVGKGEAPAELWDSPGLPDSSGRTLALLLEEREEGR